MFAVALTILIVTVCSVLMIGMAFAYLKTGVPTIASAAAAQSQVAAVLREAGAKRIYELGSGTGGFALRLGQEVPGSRVTGIELSPLAWLASLVQRLRHPARSRVEFKLGNFSDFDLRDADAAAFYLMPSPNRRLGPKLAAEMRPGTTVATVSFSMPGWKPTQVLVAPNFSKTRSYVYRMPPEPGAPPARV